jgi:glycosyltransferase involved in cell wall biosynthesis
LPRISALCATKDRPLFVRKAVELFLAQTWPNKELIVLDDGDPALTQDLAPSPLVRHIRFEKPTSVSCKHRAGFELASGEFLCYWDDDDWYGARRLATQAAPLLRDDADIVGTWIDQVVTVPDVRFFRFDPGTVEDWAPPLPAPCGIPFPFHDGTAMWKKSLLEGVPEEVLLGWQLYLLDHLRERGARVGKVWPSDLFVYVRHGNNLWQFDEARVLTETACPPWLPREMLSFWANPALRRA